MIRDRRVLGLIPARGGSKGLPGKNTRDLCGKPLIAWSIDAARGSKYLDEVVVSTDSEEIATVAARHGAKPPFLRPAELATDQAASIDVVAHALEHYRGRGVSFDYLALIEPTSPLREAADIDAALEQLIDSGAESIVSVCLAEATHPAFMFRKGAGGKLDPFMGPGFKALRRQDLEPLYFLEGTIYISAVESLLKRRSFYHEATVGFEVPKWKSPEVDDIVDLLWVEAIMRNRGLAP